MQPKFLFQNKAKPLFTKIKPNQFHIKLVNVWTVLYSYKTELGMHFGEKYLQSFVDDTVNSGS